MEALGSDLKRLLLYIEDEPPIAAAFHRVCPGARLAMDRRKEEEQLLEILRLQRTLEKTKSGSISPKGGQLVDDDYGMRSGSSGGSSLSSRPRFSSSSSSSGSSSSSSRSRSSLIKDQPEANKLPMIGIIPGTGSKDQDQASLLEQQKHRHAETPSVNSSNRSSSGSRSGSECLTTVLDELIGVVELQEGLLSNMMENDVKQSESLKTMLIDRSSIHQDLTLDLALPPAGSVPAAAAGEENVIAELKKRVAELETIQSQCSLVQHAKGLVLRRGFVALLQAVLLCMSFVSVFSRIENLGFVPT